MGNETLERRSKVAVEEVSGKGGLLKDSDSLVVYRPRNTSVELEVESYSAMRYHGQ